MFDILSQEIDAKLIVRIDSLHSSVCVFNAKENNT